MCFIPLGMVVVQYATLLSVNEVPCSQRHHYNEPYLHDCQGFGLCSKSNDSFKGMRPVFHSLIEFLKFLAMTDYQTAVDCLIPTASDTLL